MAIGEIFRPLVIVTFPQFHTYRFSNCSLPGDQIFAKVVYDVTECAVRCVEDTRCVSFSYMENSDEAKEEMDRLAESGSKVTDPPGRCLQFSSACHVNYIQV